MAKSPEEKDAHFAAFLAAKPHNRRPKTATSKDGVLTMPATPRIARKKHQSQRPRAARTRDRH